MTDGKRKAVVLLSGGQDSTTAFYWALELFNVVAALTFEYGQRHLAAETSMARLTANKNGVENVVIPVNELAMLRMSSLTNTAIDNVPSISSGDRRNIFAEERGLPPSFTPGRNLLFFTLGAMLCAKEEATRLVAGVCQQDEAGYPDCRPDFVALMGGAIRRGFAWDDFEIVTPLLYASKKETWELAERLGKLKEIINETASCYEGDTTEHEWGRGCEVCGACIERARGYYAFVGKGMIV